MKTTKIVIWGIASKRTECYGHGEYRKELSIQQENIYGPEEAFSIRFFFPGKEQKRIKIQ